MTRFVFRFQSLLDHRGRIEDQRQRELARHMRSSMILRDQLRKMQGAIRESRRRIGAGLVGSVNVDSITRFARFSGHTTQRGQQIVMKLAELEKQIETARGNLLEATRQRRALELLRDRHHQAWRRERQRREDLEMDELATQQYVRRLTAGSTS